MDYPYLLIRISCEEPIMNVKPNKADEKKVVEEELDPEEIALILQGRLDDCCIS